MNFRTTISVAGALLLFTFTACKKNQFENITPPPPPENLKPLNEKEQETVAKFEHASLVLQGLFSSDRQLRKEFNGFIAAKLNKSGTDEELTFQEIFDPKPVSLTGVNADFLFRFRDAFAGTFISGKFPNSSKFSTINFKNADEVAVYYDVKASNANGLFNYDDNVAIPYEIYFPYSENYDVSTDVNYAVSYHPLNNSEWNYGMFYDAMGNPLYEVTVDDEYAYGTPTYIITYDDGLKIGDFTGTNIPIESENYLVNLTDDAYNPVIKERRNPRPDSSVSVCTQELRVKDGRWTLLRNAYGIFEGKIEFAVAVSNNVTAVTVPNQNPQSNPIITLERTAHAWGYVKIKRGKVKKMRDNLDEFVSIGLYVSPWCAGQPDKMLFLYEYDKPNFFSENAATISAVLTGGIGLIGDSATRATLSALASGGLAPLVTAFLEGTAKSKIEHYSIIGSNAVFINQKNPTAGSTPSLLNGFRPYGTNSVMVSLVID